MSWTYSRITARTITQALVTDRDGTHRYYDLKLELNTHGLTSVGGGPAPGEFPHPPATGVIVQSSAGLSDRTFTSPITAGNTLVYIAGRRAGSPATPSGYTVGPDGAATDAVSDAVSVFYKLADGSESTTLGVGELNQAGAWYELAGQWAPDAHDEDTGTGATMTSGPITVAPRSFVFAIGGLGDGGGFDAGGGTVSAPAGFTTDWSQRVFDGHPLVYAGHLFSAAGGAVSAAAAFSGGGSWEWAMQLVSFVSDAIPESPPSPAQQFGPITPIPAPDGVATTFMLPDGFGFADGSLKVLVNRLDQTAAVASYDGSCGLFTLTFAPWSTDVIEVYGQGR